MEKRCEVSASPTRESVEEFWISGAGGSEGIHGSPFRGIPLPSTVSSTQVNLRDLATVADDAWPYQRG